VANELTRVTSLAGGESLTTSDRFVPHVSTVPANRGRTVGLHLREKVLANRLEPDGAARAPVVLFVHGGYSPAVVAYDLDFQDYSWMVQLARAGFDVFAMTHTGYGSSPKPMMDDPCNVAAPDQAQLIPRVLRETCEPRYPFKLVSSQTEWDEVKSVAAYIRALRQTDRISLVGWSTGAPRAGGFAAMHPEQVDKLVLLAPSPFFQSDTPPEPMPEPGAPVILQSHDMLMNQRWQNHVRTDGQIEHREIGRAVGSRGRGRHAGAAPDELRLARQRGASRQADPRDAGRARQLREASRRLGRPRIPPQSVRENRRRIPLRPVRTWTPRGAHAHGRVAQERIRERRDVRRIRNRLGRQAAAAHIARRGTHESVDPARLPPARR